jgi:hypothetical protein
MKRRQSARPVVVEIKRTRSPTSPSASNSHSLATNAALWRSTPLIDTAAQIIREQDLFLDRDRGASQAAPQPVRRVLPSLIPMYEPNTPQQAVPRAERKISLQRSTRASRKVPHAAAKCDFAADAGVSEMILEQEAQGSLAEAVQLPHEPTSEPAPLDVAAPQKAAGRARGKPERELRRGEFWKRRLPRACW